MDRALWQTARMSDSSAPSRVKGKGRSGATPRAPRKRDAEVLEAAARVFHARGYTDASVQQVADELGILKGSLYHYIKTKEDLLYGLLEGVHREVREILTEVAAAPDLDPVDRLRLYVTRQIEYNVRNLVRISVYYHDFQRLGPERRKTIYAQRREHETFVADLIRQAQDSGAADPDRNPQVLANCVFGTIIWIYRWYRPRGPISARDLAMTGADFAVAGIRGSALAAD